MGTNDVTHCILFIFGSLTTLAILPMYIESKFK